MNLSNGLFSQNHTASASEIVENPVPVITCASFACLPKRSRQRFLKMIHTFTKDLFIREKVWSKMNDYERVLLKLIAKEICMQPTLIRLKLVLVCEFVSISLLCMVSEPLTFHWNGVLVTRTFETYEFLEPVAMCVMRKLLTTVSLAFLFRNLIIRYLRDQNHRNQRAQKRSSSSEIILNLVLLCVFSLYALMQVALLTTTRPRNDHPLFPFNAQFPSSPKCCCIVLCTLLRLLLRCLLVQMFFYKVYVILLRFSLSYFCSYVCNSASSVLIFVVNILICRLCFACPFR